MELSKRSPYLNAAVGRYRQGDIIRDVELIEWADIDAEGLSIRSRRIPYAVVISQECDLEHDFNNRSDPSKPVSDKYLPTILVCPAYPALMLKEGKHLEDLNLKMQLMGRDQWNRVKQNNDPRYHYLLEDQELQLPELAMDFKHYFTISRDVLYRENFRNNLVCSLGDLFREHLSSRFAYYLSRIGLPELEQAVA